MRQTTSLIEIDELMRLGNSENTHLSTNTPSSGNISSHPDSNEEVYNDEESGTSTCSNNQEYSYQHETLSDTPIIPVETDYSENNVTSEEEEQVVNSRDFVAMWAIKHNITHLALTDLLHWLCTKPDLENFPRDARTLLKTPKETPVEEHGQGQFYYFGMLEKLQQFVIQYKCNGTDKLKLDFNVDGIPLHKSTRTAFWPILCRIVSQNNDQEYIFPVAIYCGPGKPLLKTYLEKFVTELCRLVNFDVQVHHQVIPCEVRSFCCDTPARAFIKNIKGHNGYSGCDKCWVKGVSKERRMLFLDLEAPKRTDDEFSSKNDLAHHNGDTPLTKLNIGLISKCPVDYMHCVCLGVMRKLLFTYRDRRRECNISKVMLSLLNTRLIELRKCWPDDFNRKPRGLADLERWKATELHQFLIYSGPFVLKDVLPHKLYCNFMILKFAITILLVSDLNETYNEYARELLKGFVKHAVKLFGSKFCTYNTHALIHLPDDAEAFGNIYEVTCFPFENYLQMLKKMLRKSNQPLQQVVRRIEEHDQNYEANNTQFKKTSGKIFVMGRPIADYHSLDDQVGVAFKKLNFRGVILSTKCGNNCVQTKSNGIGRILYFFKHEDNISVVCEKLIVTGSFCDYPADSKLLSMFRVQLNGENFKFSVNEIAHKGLLLQCDANESFFFSPLLHFL